MCIFKISIFCSSCFVCFHYLCLCLLIFLAEGLVSPRFHMSCCRHSWYSKISKSSFHLRLRGERWCRTIHHGSASCCSPSCCEMCWQLPNRVEQIILVLCCGMFGAGCWVFQGKLSPYSLLPTCGHLPGCPGWLRMGFHNGLLSVGQLTEFPWVAITCMPRLPVCGFSKWWLFAVSSFRLHTVVGKIMPKAVHPSPQNLWLYHVSWQKGI